MMHIFGIALLSVGIQGFIFPQGSPRESLVVRHLDASTVAIPVAGLVVGAATLLSPSDREKIDDKKEVESYFNGETGFGRWNKIYSDTDDVNGVQKDIRVGHQQTIDKVLEWIDTEKVSGSWCDLGCGVGSLAIPVAQRGAQVYASDISAAMVTETMQRATDAGISLKSCETSDMENVDGSYDTVSCIDVMIHYPTDTMVNLVNKLTSLTNDRLFVSFAPNTPQLSILKAIGGLFPGPSKTARAYLHKEDDVEKALNDQGFIVKRRHLTSTGLYFSLLFEAVPAPSA